MLPKVILPMIYSLKLGYLLNINCLPNIHHSVSQALVKICTRHPVGDGDQRIQSAAGPVHKPSSEMGLCPGTPQLLRGC